MKIKPQGNRVLVELIPYDLEQDGIEIPDSHLEVTQTAKVVELGTGSMTVTGVIRPPVEVGDIVVITQTGGTKVRDGERQYQIVAPDAIQCKVEE